MSLSVIMYMWYNSEEWEVRLKRSEKW